MSNVCESIDSLVRSVGGRKFIIGLIVLFWVKGVDVVLLWQDKIAEATYIELSRIGMYLIIALFTAQVIDKKITMDIDK